MWSTAKVPIMLAVLDRAVRKQRGLTAGEQNLIRIMIQVSDNDAASALIGSVGGAAAVNSFLRRIGITNTNMNSNAWGASTTTAQDMARLMFKLADCTILVPHMCRYALQTMQNVVPAQKWGVSGGVPAGAAVALKNGWYPDIGGWGINSIGLVTSKETQYAIAVYTNSNPSMQYGIDAIQQISAQVSYAETTAVAEERQPLMRYYTVRPGDTLNGIAQSLGTSMQKIAQANDIEDPNLIYAGQALYVPDGIGAPIPWAPGTAHQNYFVPVDALTRGSPKGRNRTTYDNVIDQFAVEVNPRYRPDDRDTYCNIFV